MGVREPCGPKWDNFREEVIEAFSDARFQNYTHLTSKDDIDKVDKMAGMLHFTA